MARAARSENQSGWHHVTNRGLDRRRVFRSVDDRRDFERLLGVGHREVGVGVVAYCLMDNHFHLVLDCPSGGLSDFMQLVGGRFTKHTNERHGGDGPVFRGRFFSRAITDERYLVNAVRYVHRNPLAIRPVVALADYRWSTHRSYLTRHPTPAWVQRSPVLDWFASPADFHEFVAGDVGGGQPVGVGVRELLTAIELAVDDTVELDRSRQGLVRTVVYLSLDRVGIDTRDALVRWLGPSNTAALEQAVRRAHRRAVVEPAYLLVLERALELIAPTFTLCLTQPERRRVQESQVGRLAS